MELIKEIIDKDWPANDSSLKKREAARAILFDDKGRIPLLFVAKHHYHKLPGGGIEEDEDRKMALNREISEEVGCKAEITQEVGMVLEYRSEWNLRQTSYCYIGRIVSTGTPHFTPEESNQGFEVVWMKLDEAIAQIESDKPDNYEGSFIQKRDIEFLKKAKRMLKGK